MKRFNLNPAVVIALILSIALVIVLHCRLRTVETQRDILADIIHAEKDFQTENNDCGVDFNIYNTAQPFLEVIDMDTTQLNWSYCY